MRMSAQPSHEWQELNNEVKAQLGCESKVYVYRGLHQAIFETCFGLHLKFGHKRRIVAETGLGDHLKNTELELSRAGVRLKHHFEEDMKAEEKATLAYIHDLDDAISGELYDHIETLKKLAPTKLYRIHVAHHLFHIKKTFINKLSDFDIIICALSEDYALVFTGDKVVLPLLVAPQLSWNVQRDGQRIKGIIENDRKVYQPDIVNFETSLPSGVRPWFTVQPAKRIYDRSVVIVDDHDASALRDIILEEMQLEDLPPGSHTPIETASYCRWGNDAWFEQAYRFQRSKEDLRGLLLLDGSILTDQFKLVFKRSLEKLKELSV